MASEQELNDFLKEVERRAFKRTVYAVRDEDAALDIVQEAMISLAEKYADRPASEWPMLFQRILGNATMDWFRRRKTRDALFQNFSALEAGAGDDETFDLLEVLESDHENPGTESASDLLSRKETLAQIEQEISQLPDRQREAFLMRYWEEMDVAETAQAMGCSEGSVKTHCARAVHALAQALKAKGIVP